MNVLRTLVAIAALWALPLSAQTANFSALEQTMSTELARLEIPGASIAIVRGDQVIYSKAIGTANVETGEAMRPEMLFRLGSTTKMMTAAEIGRASLGTE